MFKVYTLFNDSISLILHLSDLSALKNGADKDITITDIKHLSNQQLVSPPNTSRFTTAYHGLEVQVSTDDQFGSHIHDHPNPEENRDLGGKKGI